MTIKKTTMNEDVSPINLVGGFKPSEEYARQIGHLPQIGVKIPKIFELPPPSNNGDVPLSC